MTTEGILIRRTRIERGWSQEALCRGVCAVSYLSKIEQGKAEASPEIIAGLFAKLGVSWHADEQELRRLNALVESVYAALFGLCRRELNAARERFCEAEEALRSSPLALDAMLLRAMLFDTRKPLAQELECCMTPRQLALQRALQGRYSETMMHYPCGWTYYLAGEEAYGSGSSYLHAMELLQTGYDLASREGNAGTMLLCRLLIGNCYCNMLDLPNMLAQYTPARRLAAALNDEELLGTIAYNTAAAQLECGDIASAYAYFSVCENPTRMGLHKLAICCEKLGRREEALAALDRAEATACTVVDDALSREMCELVRMRLKNPDYLRDGEYGRRLLDCFEACRRTLSSGYASFHLPWVLEWYAANRQYKQAYTLLQQFPYAARINGFPEKNE